MTTQEILSRKLTGAKLQRQGVDLYDLPQDDSQDSACLRVGWRRSAAGIAIRQRVA